MSGVVDPDSVAVAVAAVRERIVTAGGTDVRLVAVTKAFGPAAVDAVVAAGVDDIGESYAQELSAKLPEVTATPRPTVHFVGRLQTNKVRRIADAVDVWQSVDRLKVGREIARRAPGAAVLVQVDISGEASKGGCPPRRTGDLVEALVSEGLDVRGLMGIGPLAEPDAARPGFRRLRALVDELGLAECSMGMTDDFEIAVAEGASMVRVGRSLFGERPSRGG